MWYLEGLFGDGVVLVTTEPRLLTPGLQTVPKHVDVEEDVLLVRKVLSPKLNHQLPEDVRVTAHEHDCDRDGVALVITPMSRHTSFPPHLTSSSSDVTFGSFKYE